jgi:amidohydrolase
MATGIKELAEKHEPYIIEQRRWFHRHPELSYKEIETTKTIKARLEEMGIPVSTFDGLPGCVGVIKGGLGEGKTVLLRADIDALEVEEKTGLPFASETKGRMHACGHDAHIAMLLGAAKILMDSRDLFRGEVKLFFQSGEETAQGAMHAVERGVLKGVDATFGMHIWAGLDAPKFSFEPGERMASCDTFLLRILGNSSHGSAPHLGHDAIVAAASCVMNLQTIASRINDPLNSLVVTVGTIHGGQRFNIIANKVEMDCTVRTFNREFRMKIEGIIRDMAEKTAAALGCSAELEYHYLTGAVINDDAELAALAAGAAEKLYGADATTHMDKITGSEDFAYLMDGVRSVYGFIGARSPDVPGSELSNHHECFTVDERSLHRGAGVMAQFAADFLAR